MVEKGSQTHRLPDFQINPQLRETSLSLSNAAWTNNQTLDHFNTNQSIYTGCHPFKITFLKVKCYKVLLKILVQLFYLLLVPLLISKIFLINIWMTKIWILNHKLRYIGSCILRLKNPTKSSVIKAKM